MESKVWSKLTIVGQAGSPESPAAATLMWDATRVPAYVSLRLQDESGLGLDVNMKTRSSLRFTVQGDFHLSFSITADLPRVKITLPDVLPVDGGLPVVRAGGAPVALTGRVIGYEDQALRWSVTPPIGSISVPDLRQPFDALYTPPKPTELIERSIVTITAVSATAGGLSDSVALWVWPQVAVAIEPSRAAATLGGSPLSFTATVANSLIPGVSWRLEPEDLGTLVNATSTSVHYVPPSALPPGSRTNVVHIIAASLEDPTAVGTAEIGFEDVIVDLVLGSNPAPPGGMVWVTVSAWAHGDIPIDGLQMTISYDPAVLVPDATTDGDVTVGPLSDDVVAVQAFTNEAVSPNEVSFAALMRPGSAFTKGSVARVLFRARQDAPLGTITHVQAKSSKVVSANQALVLGVVTPAIVRVQQTKKLTVSDATVALRMAVKLPVDPTADPQALDVDGDGRVTVRDAVVILRSAVGLPTG